MSDRYDAADDEEDEDTLVEIVAPPAEKLREVEKRKASRNTFGSLSIADFGGQDRKFLATFDMLDGRSGSMFVTYDPHLVNDALNAQIKQLNADGDTLGAATVFCRVVKDWGLMGRLTIERLQVDENDKVQRDERGQPIFERVTIVPDGEAVPLVPEVVQYVSNVITVGVWGAMNKDIATGGKPKDSRKR